MAPDPSGVRRLYEQRADRYLAFVRFFHSRRGLQALLERTDLLRPRMQVLDAGCGAGLATFALLDALEARRVEPGTVDAFDLTPAMLARFRDELAARGLRKRVEMREANILDETALPDTWTGYDLVVSTSMLEYLPRERLAQALTMLRRRMSPQGHLLAMVTRRSPEAKVLIEWGWHAERYSAGELRDRFTQAGFRQLDFVRFPLRHGWLNRANHVVIATPPAAFA
ncbi:MAG TPA: class I SAM-dependent methyltransferase [Rhodanobacteraceae bacterium]|jgi:cyclopropane fatty-acyl-phospholipid synthase-like methyltransferase|nr:class I SAM-dependent methyltransferase [Rhodanobacteraceae bacterium]